MALSDIVSAADGELLGLYVLGTYAIALIVGGLLGPVLRWGGFKTPRWAPVAWLWGLLWFVFYAFNGVSAYLVRTAPADPGAVWDVNARALYVYLSLQIWLALYWIMAWFIWHAFAAFFALIAVILAGVIAYLFYEFTVTGTVLMSIAALFLVFVLVFHVAMLWYDSETFARRAARSQSTSESLREERRRNASRDEDDEDEDDVETGRSRTKTRSYKARVANK